MPRPAASSLGLTTLAPAAGSIAHGTTIVTNAIVEGAGMPDGPP
jgi:N-methylhydantoinase A/oxoprolinase/acetone carboxylase beta subunit